MTQTKADPAEATYPLRSAVRLTGLSPETLRAWERRHAVVTPYRTPGGTRRYTAADLDRLRLVKAAVDSGHRIGRVAKLDANELKQTLGVVDSRVSGPLDEIIAAVDRLDDGAAHRLLSEELAKRGPSNFAQEIAIPLVQEIGELWLGDEIQIASEHMATGILRSLLGSALQTSNTSHTGPRIVFATPTGERHEVGLLAAALTALGAGASPLYLGVDLPVEELLSVSANGAGVDVLALSLVTSSESQANRIVQTLRGGLPDRVLLWLGGSGASKLEGYDGVEIISSLPALEQRVGVFVADRTSGP